MRKLPLFIFLFLVKSYSLFAQNEQHAFEIAGKINADTGEVMLQVLFDHDYYPKQVEKKMTGQVKNGEFTLSGYITYPQGVMLFYGDQYYSKVFVIDAGKTNYYRRYTGKP
jgi:hypothetical protein